MAHGGVAKCASLARRPNKNEKKKRKIKEQNTLANAKHNY